VRIDGNNRFAISAPENGFSESFDSEIEFEIALGKLGFPRGFSSDVVKTLQDRGIVWLDLEPTADLAVLKGLSHTGRMH